MNRWDKKTVDTRSTASSSPQHGQQRQNRQSTLREDNFFIARDTAVQRDEHDIEEKHRDDLDRLADEQPVQQADTDQAVIDALVLEQYRYRITRELLLRHVEDTGRRF